MTSIELDVVLTRDAVPVVFHDLALNPDIVRDAAGHWITPPGAAIATLLAADLAAFDVGRLRPNSSTAARFPAQAPIEGARIPTLAATLAALRESPVRLDIELKCAPATSPAALVDAVLAAIAAARPVTPPSFRSFHWPALRLIRARDPAIPLAWLTPSGFAPSAVAGEIAQCGWPAWQPVWAPDHRTLLKRDIQQARGLGLAVKPWTVNDPARMRQLLAWGAAGLCTDFPDRCLEIARSW